MPRSALIVVDVQDSFLHRAYWDETELPAFRSSLLSLIAGCKARGVPVAYILHEDSDGPFSAASGFVRLQAWMPKDPDVTFTKHVHNAFTDTKLGEWLKERSISNVIVSGIRTEQCCETTTRVAFDLGYTVDYVTEATLTFPMVHPQTGRTFSAAELRERTELVLAGRFATIHTVQSVLASLDAKQVA